MGSFGVSLLHIYSIGVTLLDIGSFGVPRLNIYSIGVPLLDIGSFGVPLLNIYSIGVPLLDISSFGVPKVTNIFGFLEWQRKKRLKNLRPNAQITNIQV